jgi:hypothetical protein
VFLRPPGSDAEAGGTLESIETSPFGAVPHTTEPIGFSSPLEAFGAWVLKARSEDIEKINEDLYDKVPVNGNTIYRLKPDVIEDVLVICHYSVS